MTYLLDTNILLWSIFQVDLLPARAKHLLLDAANRFAYSPISIWEVGIKHAKHPATFPVQPEQLLWAVRELGYIELSVTSEHGVAASRLPQHHREPFDRMLVAQAQSESLPLLTVDEALLLYGTNIQVV